MMSASASGAASRVVGGLLTGAAAAPLRVADLERAFPTRESTLPSRRAAARAQAEEEAYRAAREARLASPLPQGRLPVRALLEGIRSPEGAAAQAEHAALCAVASATGPSVKRRPLSSRRYVPDPRFAPRPAVGYATAGR